MSWNKKFIELAKHISTWSKDPSTKIGVVAINPDTKNILSTGYNGFPRGFYDSDERLNNRNIKYEYVVHGEQNCIYNATRNGVSLKGSHLYVYGMYVCHKCAAAIVQVGIKKVFVKVDSDRMEAWKESAEMTENIFKECGVEIEYL